MEKGISRKSIFLSAWKNKIGYLLNYKDFDELETIIDYYEIQLKKQKEIIDKAINELYEFRTSHCIEEDIECKEITHILETLGVGKEEYI